MNLDVQLAQFKAAQLVRRAGDIELTYQFKHPLVQETAIADHTSSELRESFLNQSHIRKRQVLCGKMK